MKQDASRYFDDLQIGDRWVSEERTLREEDILDFAETTGDYDPLHVDAEYAASTVYGKPIAHGLLGLSWSAGLNSIAPRVQTLAFSEIRSWKFLAPIYIGDVVHSVAEIIEKGRPGRRSGSVVWRRSLYNHDGDLVQVGEFVTIVAVAEQKKAARSTTAAERSAASVR